MLSDFRSLSISAKNASVIFISRVYDYFFMNMIHGLYGKTGTFQMSLVNRKQSSTEFRTIVFY